jgi:hypothetical protein
MKAQFPNFLARALAASAMLGAMTVATLAAPPARPIAAPATRVDRDFGKLPLSFEPNQGQTGDKVQFLSRGQGYALFLTPGEAVLELQKSNRKTIDAASAFPTPSVLRMTLLGANAKAAVSGEQRLPGTSNYFIGNDSSTWHTSVPTYKRVAYTAVYPGVDLVYYGNQRQLEYDFVVAPGADAAKIALQFTGATPVIDNAGDLVLAVQGEEARFHKPMIYQLDGDRKVSVAGSYQIAEGKVGFALGAYDHSKPLVIDPVLSYMTYLGGASEDDMKGMAVDAQGNVIVVGTTFSTDFPLKSAYDSTAISYNANYPHTMFVSKLNPTGTALVYSTFLGSSTAAAAVAVDPSGNAYVYATTDDPNYPITAGAYQTICGANFNQSTGARIAGCSTQVASGNNSTVLSKISPDGSQLVYSTFLSGSNGHIAQAVAVNAAGEAYVVGVTNGQCTSAPAYYCIANTANASEALLSNQGDTYGFLVKFNAQGSGLLYSTKIYNHNPVGHYLSGIKLNAIALDAAGNAYVTGNMDSNYFITITPGALQSTRFSTSLPAFVAKFNPSGTAATSLVYSTYLSGTTYSTDYANGITVDSSGNAIVAGYTNSCTFPTTQGAFSTVPGGSVSGNICAGGFLTKLNAAGTGLVWSTYTGANGASGRNNDSNDAVALGPDGTVYVAGDENGVALSPSVNPLAGQSDNNRTYIKQFSADGSKVVFSSGLGGTPGDSQGIPVSIVVDPASNIYIAGATTDPSWPVTAGAFQKSNAGGANDGYIVKIIPQATTTTALTLPTGTITAGQNVKLSAKVTGQTGSTGTPTGTVTFLSGSTTLGTGTLDSTATATYTAASLNATTYSITASYAGDTAFSGSVSAAQNLVVATVTPTVTLTAPSTAAVGASVTLSVVVAGTPGTPTGTVTFKDGTSTLSTATLASGAASYSTPALTAGSHSITVSYAGDSIFGAATSAASTVTINVAPAISFAAQPSSLTVVHGSSGTVVITGTPVGGYTGTVTFACGTLPTGASCLFAPTSLAFTGNNTAASTTLTFATVTTVAALQSLPGRKTLTPLFAALLLLPLGFQLKRKRMRGGIVLSLLLLASIAGLGGCSSSTKNPTTVTTATGSYTVPVTITAGTAVSTLNVSVIVQ